MTEYIEINMRIEGSVGGTTRTMTLKNKSGILSEDFKDMVWSDHHIDVDDL